MKKFFYYALAVYMTVVPFAFLMLGFIYLAYTPINNYDLAAIGVVGFGVYFSYLVWMFED